MRRTRSEQHRPRTGAAATLTTLGTIPSNDEQETPDIQWRSTSKIPGDEHVVEEDVSGSCRRVVSPTGVADALTQDPTAVGKEEGHPPEDVTKNNDLASVKGNSHVTEAPTSTTIDGEHHRDDEDDDNDTVTSLRRGGRGMRGWLADKVKNPLTPFQMHRQSSQKHQEEVSERRRLLSNPYRMYKASSTNSKDDEKIVSSIVKAEEQKKKFLSTPSAVVSPTKAVTSTVAPSKGHIHLTATTNIAAMREESTPKTPPLEAIVAQAAQNAAKTEVCEDSPVQGNHSHNERPQETSMKSLSPSVEAPEQHVKDNLESRIEETPMKSLSPVNLQNPPSEENNVENHETRLEGTPVTFTAPIRSQTCAPGEEQSRSANEGARREETQMKSVSPLRPKSCNPHEHTVDNDEVLEDSVSSLPHPQQIRVPPERSGDHDPNGRGETNIEPLSPPRQRTRVSRDIKKTTPKKTPKEKGQESSLLLDLTSDISLRASSQFKSSSSPMDKESSRPSKETQNEHRQRSSRLSERKNRPSLNTCERKYRRAQEIQQRPLSPADTSRRIDSVPSKISLLVAVDPKKAGKLQRTERQRREDVWMDRQERRSKHHRVEDDYSESTASESTSVRDMPYESSQSGSYRRGDSANFCSDDDSSGLSDNDDEYTRNIHRCNYPRTSKGHDNSVRSSYGHDDDNSTLESSSYFSKHADSTKKKIELYLGHSACRRQQRDKRPSHKLARSHSENVSKSSFMLRRSHCQRHRERVRKIDHESSWDDSDIVSKASYLLSRAATETSHFFKRTPSGVDSVSAASSAFDSIHTGILRMQTHSTTGDESAFSTIKPDKTERVHLDETPIEFDFFSDGEGDSDIELERVLSYKGHSGWLCGWFG